MSEYIEGGKITNKGLGQPTWATGGIISNPINSAIQAFIDNTKQTSPVLGVDDDRIFSYYPTPQAQLTKISRNIQVESVGTTDFLNLGILGVAGTVNPSRPAASSWVSLNKNEVDDLITVLTYYRQQLT